MRVEGDVHVAGVLTATTHTPSALAVTNAHVATAAAIAATKLQHQHQKTYAVESGTATTDGAFVVHVSEGAGTIIGFEIGAVVACVGAAVLDVDLLINGLTCLTGAVRLDSGDAGYAIVQGTIDSGTLAAGKVVEVSINETAGGGTAPKGFFCNVIIQEAAE